MTRSVRQFASLLMVLVSLVLSGCGSGRQLQSVALSPAAADARNSPNGQVNFTATGTFSKPPSPVQLTSSDVLWCVGTNNGACAGNIVTGAFVDQNGVAQCVSGFAGAATILAGKAQPVTMPDVGPQLTVYGSAQLTCP